MSYEETRDKIRGILVQQDVLIERKGDDYKYMFKVRPLSAREFAVMTQGKQGQDGGVGFNLVEDVLVACVISPKIVRTVPDETPAENLSIDSLPIDLANKTFEKIFQISGLGPDEDEEAKN